LEVQSQINNVRTLAQSAAAMKQAQIQQEAAKFQEFAAASDNAFSKSVADESPATVRQVSEFALKMLRDSGLSDQMISHYWNTDPVLRSQFGQRVLYDAAKFRMMVANPPKPAPTPPPRVQRPGSSLDRPDASERDYYATEGRFNGPLSVKQATELTLARRARGRR